MAEPLVPRTAATVDDGVVAGGAATSTAARVEASSGAEASKGQALQATAGWAVPLQWVAILGSGGIAIVSALIHRWHGYDWLFVLLCALYVANAVGFRRLSKRGVR